MKKRRNLGGWIVCIAVALVICAAVVWSEKADETLRLSAMLCDGFFVAGALLTGLGGLIWVANFGGFNAVGYGAYLLVRKLTLSKNKFAERKSYLEYSAEKQEGKKAPTCILATGLACLALSLACLGLYYL